MKQKLTLLILLSIFVLGFRIYPGGNLWEISKDDPKLYVKFCEQMVPNENDLLEGDPLKGQTLTHNAVVDSILNDFTNVQGAYVVLADADRDPSYSSVQNSKRLIEVCFSGQQEFIEGHASPKYNDEGTKYAGCTVKLGRKTLDSAKRFIRTLTHEIGHCLAMDHPQETNNSIMSYFSGRDTYRLQADDKAALVYLYPVNPEDVEPYATLGMACSPR